MSESHLEPRRKGNEPFSTFPVNRPSLSIATYNVHQWVGMDGICNSARILRVIGELKAEVIGLQEVSFPSADGHILNERDLAELTGMEVVCGPTICRGDSNYGNVLLSAHPVLKVRRIDLTFHSREPRGALDVDLDVEGVTVRIVATHFGLNAAERRRQTEMLLDFLLEKQTDLVVLMGDINEWLPRSTVLRKISALFPPSPAPRTFPSRIPMLALDRIWVRPSRVLAETKVHITSASRIASDHLPLKAVLDISVSSEQ